LVAELDEEVFGFLRLDHYGTYGAVFGCTAFEQNVFHTRFKANKFENKVL
jgi:hypothetical protein